MPGALVVGISLGVVVLILAIVAIYMIKESGPGKKGRYILVERVGPATQGYQSIAFEDLKVLDGDGVSLLTNATATSGSVYSANVGSASNLIDTAAGTIAHTADLYGSDYSNAWFKVDLGSEKKIAKIILKNRAESGLHYRAVGVRVRVTDAANKDVFKGPTITDAAPEYVYNVV